MNPNGDQGSTDIQTFDPDALRALLQPTTGNLPITNSADSSAALRRSRDVCTHLNPWKMLRNHGNYRLWAKIC
eukprot:2763699-Amphidinium_carterae.1